MEATPPKNNANRVFADGKEPKTGTNTLIHKTHTKLGFNKTYHVKMERLMYEPTRALDDDQK
jgi:hypothetical protein